MLTRRFILMPVTAALVLTAFVASSSKPLAASDLFLGGGQSGEVDALLAYEAPQARSTDLPAGTTSYPVTVAFNSGIDPSTLEISLNGSYITGWFYPAAPGSTQTVALPVGPGRNVLKLSVHGNVGGRSAADQDQLVLNVAR